MAINGISTQQVSGISPNAGVSANGGASIESVSNAISAAANKGIPLSVITTLALSELYGKEARYCSNRKEVKDHGDTGILLGSALHDGDRVVIVEDVTTSGNKGFTPAGPTVTERDSRGSTYGFTPYHDHNGNKMVYLESRSASGVVSHMPLKLEQLESLCSRRGIAVPSLQYN